MALTPGTKLGPYEIIDLLGAGGMGEVFRARDPRLGREVAIKVLPASFAADTDRLRRFEQEARAVAALNHPNILAIHDIGTSEGAPYIVSELLDGESLRKRLAGGALPVRKAIDYATQIAQGLAAAHDKGIVHRDLKPENIMITRDGRAKILDFGLAKLTQAQDQSAETLSHQTEAGTVLGTVGYMSPEQVRGKPADQRSDIFSFGAILYEMLSGRRAFHGETAADTMSAILREEPEELSQTNRAVAPGLERIVHHCLEKNPEERFQAARDIAFDLQQLSGQTPSATRLAIPARKFRNWQPVAAIAAIIIALVAGYWTGRGASAPSPRFEQLTFQRGSIQSAAFAPDGQTVIYSAMWAGKPVPEIFSTRIGDLLSRPLQLDDNQVDDISSTGEMALLEHWRAISGWTGNAMLARMAISGGAPREILDKVQSAGWSPDGSQLAVALAKGGKHQLEYPIGNVLFETNGWIDGVRVSPDGKQVAFIEHPGLGDSRGQIMLVGADKKARPLLQVWSDAAGLAWSQSGEVWFTASDNGLNRSLYAATTSGKLRTVLRVPGSLTLYGISRNGKVLLSNDSFRRGTSGFHEGDKSERDLTWFDWTRTSALSADGQWVLFDEEAQGGGPSYTVYIRKTDGSPAIRLGSGFSVALSPDGRWALAGDLKTRQYTLYPTGAGEPRPITHDNIYRYGGQFTPDGKSIVFMGHELGKDDRIWIMPADGGTAQPVTPDGILGGAVTPSGQSLLARDNDRKFFLYPLHGGGQPVALPQLKADDGPLAWAGNDHTLFVREHVTDVSQLRIVKLDLNTGARELYRQIEPGDRTGILSLGPVQITPDGKSYVYGYLRRLSDLYVVDGLK
jgi:serine/threonine protein kinase/Tol biopolymer transport system component